MSRPSPQNNEDQSEYAMFPTGVPLQQWQMNNIYGSGSSQTSPPMTASASGSVQPHIFPAGSPHQPMESYLNPATTTVTLPPRGSNIGQLTSHYPTASSHFAHGSQSPSNSPMLNYSQSSSGAYASTIPSGPPLFPSYPHSVQSTSHLAVHQPTGFQTQHALQPTVDPSLPIDVQNAMHAAYASSEWANGQNVPPEIIMPTVEKVGKELFRCRLCGKDHKRRDHCLTHVRTAHLGNKGFKCSQCDSAFGRKGDLERHEASTHGGTQYETVCQYCHSRLQRKDNYPRHLKTCKVALSLADQSQLQSHLQSTGHSAGIASIAPYHYPPLTSESSSGGRVTRASRSGRTSRSSSRGSRGSAHSHSQSHSVSQSSTAYQGSSASGGNWGSHNPYPTVPTRHIRQQSRSNIFPLTPVTPIATQNVFPDQLRPASLSIEPPSSSNSASFSLYPQYPGNSQTAPGSQNSQHSQYPSYSHFPHSPQSPQSSQSSQSSNYSYSPESFKYSSSFGNLELQPPQLQPTIWQPQIMSSMTSPMISYDYSTMDTTGWNNSRII